MARAFPLEYNFVPKTWILPSDYVSFQAYAHSTKKNQKRSKTFIMKPANGAMGNGYGTEFYNALLKNIK